MAQEMYGARNWASDEQMCWVKCSEKLAMARAKKNRIQSSGIWHSKFEYHKFVDSFDGLDGNFGMLALNGPGDVRGKELGK